jgi:hypothetical protein
MTVALHEFGHALGMGHSQIGGAVMWPGYNSSKQALASDDISGIQSIYQARPPDFLEPNDKASQASDISRYIGSNGQLTISSLDSTPADGSIDPGWFKITVPSSTAGKMTVRMQSTNLSLLAPSLAVFNSAGSTILGQQTSNNMGDTVTVTLTNVSPGQVYDIRCQGATTGDSGFGAYGLQVNFSSLSQASIPPPNTTVASAPDQGGGSIPDVKHINQGSLSGWGDTMTIDDAADASLDPLGAAPAAPWTPSWQPPGPITIFGPALGTDDSSQNLLTTLSFFSLNDFGKPSLPTPSLSKNRSSESMYYEAVDRALEISMSHPPG